MKKRNWKLQFEAPAVIFGLLVAIGIGISPTFSYSQTNSDNQHKHETPPSSLEKALDQNHQGTVRRKENPGKGKQSIQKKSMGGGMMDHDNMMQMMNQMHGNMGNMKQQQPMQNQGQMNQQEMGKSGMGMMENEMGGKQNA